MDARTAWETWRRILTSDDLAAAVLQGDTDFEAFALTAEESAIAADYAGTPAATDQIIFMYRSGLVRNALCALRLAPLANRLLDTSGLDAQEVARELTESIGYRDDGPNLWRLAAAFVDYLAGLPQFSEGPKADALAVEAGAIALMRRGGRGAVTASSQHDLTPWLEEPFDFDPEATLERAPRHWLIYLPATDAAPAYAELSERAAGVFALLTAGKRPAEIAAALGLSESEAQEIIVALAEIGSQS